MAPSKKKKDEDIDSTPLLKVNGLKMQRNIDENKLKVNEPFFFFFFFVICFVKCMITF